MKISLRLIVLMVFASASIVLAAAKPSKEAKMTVKDANTAAKEAQAPAAEAAAEKKAPEAPPPVRDASRRAKPEVKAPMAEPPRTEPPVAAAPPAADTGVAVTVNGTDITEADVDARMQKQMQRIPRQMDPNVAEQYKKRIRNQVLENMIKLHLLDEQVKKANIAVTDSDVNDRISEIATRQGMTMETFKSALKTQGLDFEQAQKDIRRALLYEKLIDSQIGAIDINNAEAMAFYEENKEHYNTPEQVRASHILIKPDPNIADANEARRKAVAKAEDLLKRIKAGEDFATLAMANSDCPSKDRGGDLGFFARGQMVPAFENAAFGMEVNQVSGPVESQFGQHIIKLTGRKPAGVTSFEEAKPEIIKMLQNNKKGQLSMQYIEKLKAEAKIVYPPGKEPVSMTPPPAPKPVEKEPKPE
jgi:peptidyl-prolyl cis-trans isomerase C